MVVIRTITFLDDIFLYHKINFSYQQSSAQMVEWFLLSLEFRVQSSYRSTLVIYELLFWVWVRSLWKFHASHSSFLRHRIVLMPSVVVEQTLYTFKTNTIHINPNSLFPVIHEKIFIVFMVAALLHMLCRARVGCIASDVVEPVRTNKLVWTLFYVAIAATIGLIIFFLRHRLLCRPLGKKNSITYLYLTIKIFFWGKSIFCFYLYLW